MIPERDPFKEEEEAIFGPPNVGTQVVGTYIQLRDQAEADERNDTRPRCQGCGRSGGDRLDARGRSHGVYNMGGEWWHLRCRQLVDRVR